MLNFYIKGTKTSAALHTVRVHVHMYVLHFITRNRIRQTATFPAATATYSVT